MLDFDTQCCDAADYLSLGARCAQGGDCIDNLRPLGSVLWFAWPEYFGLPSSILVYVQLLLLLVSILLSAASLQRVLRSVGAQSGWSYLVLLVASIALHYFYFQPVLQVSLSDGPAGLLALNGCWLLLYASLAQGWRAALGLAASGLLLGLAAWLRAFNLYPLLALLGIYLLLWCSRRSRRAVELVVLTALIPVVLQYVAIWWRYDGLGFIAPQLTNSWQKTHLSDDAIGYDTVLPHGGIRYFSECPRSGGLLGAIEQRNFMPYLCTLERRWQFYWGSDLRYIYISPKQLGNLLRYSEQLDAHVHWFRPGLTVLPDAERAPNGNVSAERFSMDNKIFHPDNPKEVFTGVLIQHAGDYTFSAWLWSPQRKYIDMLILPSTPGATPLLQQRVLLSEQPTRYQFTQTLPEGYVLLSLRAVGGSTDNIGSDVGDTFSAWGVVFEQGAKASAYNLSGRADEDHRRYSLALFTANIAAFPLALSLFAHAPLRQSALIAVAVFAAASFGEALLIVPEQRFVMVPQVLMWVLAVTAMLLHGAVCRRALNSLRLA